MSSSSDIAVRVTGLSKKYRKGEYAHHSHVIEAIKGLNPFRSQEARQAAAAEHAKLDFWALKDVSFEIPKGEVLGVIGRNGAGKSTLLKILSQITPPTEGRVEVKGRLGALLEVGTGFHPDLTGRENIFLNGTIMGMTRSEIKAEFDSIVDFSGVEEFIDTPVKRYSSGMYTRLAFAVAAHLRNEVLIVDEVLAVGDTEFQKKCLGKMQDVSESGRTVLFVSHNMHVMAQLCSRVLSLEKGRVVEQGTDVAGIVGRYLLGGQEKNGTICYPKASTPENPHFKIRCFALVGQDGKQITSDSLTRDDEVWVAVEGEVVDHFDKLTIGYYVYTEDGSCVYVSWNLDAAPDVVMEYKKGLMAVKTRIPLEMFNLGRYSVALSIIANGTYAVRPDEGEFRLSFDVALYGRMSPHRQAKSSGFVAPVLKWEMADMGIFRKEGV